MAIGTGAAILGAAALGAGGSAIAARSQSRAVERAAQAQQQATDQASQVQRDIFNRQVQLAEPFRQYGIQQANAMGEILGFDAVGQPQQAGVPGAGSAAGGGAGQSALDAFLRSRNVAINPSQRAMMNSASPMAFLEDAADAAPVGAAMTNPGGAVSGPINVTNTGGVAGSGQGSPVNTARQETARERFGGSLFADALQGQLGRAATGVDANFAAAGNVYSGAREQAQANTAADLGMNALAQYTNFMMGAPNATGAQMASNAAGAYGANMGNLLTQQGANAANSAYAQGQIGSNLIGDLTGLAAYGVGAYPWGRGNSTIRVPGSNRPANLPDVPIPTFRG